MPISAYPKFFGVDIFSNGVYYIDGDKVNIISSYSAPNVDFKCKSKGLDNCSVCYNYVAGRSVSNPGCYLCAYNRSSDLKSCLAAGKDPKPPATCKTYYDSAECVR
jgi:hypothetical protein